MKNPLYKRVPREFKKDMGKFIALFLFLTITIGFESGFLVADNSMKKTYDESFQEYNIENGHFILTEKASPDLVKEIEKEGVKIYPLFYKERLLENDHDIRIFKIRKEVNRSDLMEGSYPQNPKEIVIDRLYAENNNINLGDKLKIDESEFKVVGTVALSDYSALYKNSRALMFNATNFTIALVSDSDFEKINSSKMKYSYAWVNEDRALSDQEQMDQAETLKKRLIKLTLIEDFVPRQMNQAITFTGDDMGKDKVMLLWLGGIIMVVLAFAFAATVRSTIEDEALVIGTLRASGYGKWELMLHYMIPPIIILLVSAIAGNLIGYTYMKEVVTGLYYHSYSLPNYVTLWNEEAFIMTTVGPLLILAVVNFLVLLRLFHLPPLNFLRKDFKGKAGHGVMKLRRGKFMTKFRIRVISQNKGIYLTLIAGIFLASVLMFFGTMMNPLLMNYREDVKKSELAPYQYLLKTPMETETEGAEKYCFTMLETEKEDDISVYGFSEKTEAMNLDGLENFGKGRKAYVSDGYMEKYGLEVGDTIELKEEYGDGDYTLEVAGSYVYPSALSVFISDRQFKEVFHKEENQYFSGYLSPEKIRDIPEVNIAATITEKDLNILVDQLEDSMGGFFRMSGGFVIILFILIIYLLSKVVIEKNTRSISMIKILGYNNREVGKIYNSATGIVVLFGLILSVILGRPFIKVMYYAMMQKFPGWLPFHLENRLSFLVVGTGIICYILVSFIERRRIKNIPLSEALKDME